MVFFPELLMSCLENARKKVGKDKLKNEELKKCCAIAFSFIQEC